MSYAFPYLHFNAVCLILVMSAVSAASIAIWAGTSRRHWFWRALAVWMMAVAPIPVRSYESAGILAITLPLLAITIAFLDRFLRLDQTWSQRATIRFPLRDIFLLTLGTALAVAAVLHWWRDVNQLGIISGGRHWGALLVHFTLAGTAFWTLTILAWLTATRYRVLGGLTLLAAIPTFAYAIPVVGKMTLFGIRFDYLPPWQALGIDFGPRPLGPAPFILGLVFSEFAVALLAALAITKRLALTPLSDSRPSLRTRHYVLRICLALPFLLLTIIYLKMIWLTPLPARFSNECNNHERLLQIMRESERLAKPPVAPASQQQQLTLIDEASQLAQSPNYIPYNPIEDVAIPNRLNHYYVDHHNRLRLFGKRIDAEAAAAIERGDRAKALDYALTNVGLGLMLQRGATYFDVMFGNALHLLAQQRLASLRRDLSPDDARRVIQAIKHAVDQAEDASAVIARSRAFEERIYLWSGRLHDVVEDFGLGGIGMDDAALLRRSVKRREATFRLLQADLALRLYHHDHGAYPQSLDPLVPDYLSQLPIDPHSGRPFIYRPDGGDFLLYSVGKDGIDNGGQFTNSAAYTRVIGGSTETPGYDFDLDALIRP